MFETVLSFAWHREKEAFAQQVSTLQASMDESKARLEAAVKERAEIALECENLRAAVSALSTSLHHMMPINIYML